MNRKAGRKGYRGKGREWDDFISILFSFPFSNYLATALFVFFVGNYALGCVEALSLVYLIN